MDMASKQTRRVKASDRVDFNKYIDGMINAGWTEERRKNMKNNGMDIYDETIIKEVNGREVDALSDSEIASIMNHAMIAGLKATREALLKVIADRELMESYAEVDLELYLHAALGAHQVAKNDFQTSAEANVNISSARTMIAETVEKYKLQEYIV